MGKSLINDPQIFEAIRIQGRGAMPISDRFAYFDHAAVAPLSRPASNEMRRWIDQASQVGDLSWPEWAMEMERLRERAAGLIHAQIDEIALIPNTSTGISFVAEGIHWKEGDNVVFPDDEFPSNALPWQHLASRGVEPRRIPWIREGRLCFDTLSRAIDRRTRLVAMSWVGFSSGLRIPLSEVLDLVHSRGALFFLDAIQGLGAFPLDVGRTPIDFLAADGHKWLLGPEGAGILYVRRNRLEEIRPSVVGWGSIQNAAQFTSHELQWKNSAGRFEAGSTNMIGMTGLNASMKMLMDFGCHRTDGDIEPMILHNGAALVEGLQRLGANVYVSEKEEYRSGIVSFEFAGEDPLAIRRWLLQADIVLSVRCGRLRASTHFYNNSSDLDRLFQQLGNRHD